MAKERVEPRSSASSSLLFALATMLALSHFSSVPRMPPGWYPTSLLCPWNPITSCPHVKVRASGGSVEVVHIILTGGNLRGTI